MWSYLFYSVPVTDTDIFWVPSVHVSPCNGRRLVAMTTLCEYQYWARPRWGCLVALSCLLLLLLSGYASSSVPVVGLLMGVDPSNATAWLIHMEMHLSFCHGTDACWLHAEFYWVCFPPKHKNRGGGTPSYCILHFTSFIWTQMSV